MQMITTNFGNFQIDESEIINFPQGVPGFTEIHRFVLLPHEEGSPVCFLQCLDDVSISFVITNPLGFFPDYKVEAGVEDLVELGLEKIEDALVFSILVVSQDPKQITANLLGPLLINPDKKLAKQIIMAGDKYTTRQKLFA